MEEVPEHNQYLQIAGNLGIFYEAELKILERVLDDYQHARDGYTIIDERRDNRMLGFVIFGQIPLTIFGWDIYWLVVDKQWQGKGIGKKLLKSVEEHILKRQPRGNLRVETSARKEYAHARNLYGKMGFVEAGRIADYYDQGDDGIIFCKQISRQE